MTTLYGKVTNALTNAAIENATVVITNNHYNVSALTDQNGDYEMIVQTGKYTLRTIHRKYRKMAQLVQIGGDTELNIPMKPLEKAE